MSHLAARLCALFILYVCRGEHYGLHLELVTVHYLPSMRSWWGWKRRIEIGGSGKGRA